MPKSKNPNAYPYTYSILFKQVVEGKTVTLNFPTKAEAKNYQFDMYGYRTALEHIRDPFYNKAASIVFSIRMELDTTYNLILRSQLDNPINDVILTALGGAKETLETPATAPTTDSSGIAAPAVTAIPSITEDGDAGEAALAKFGYGTEYNQGGGASVNTEADTVAFMTDLQPDKESGTKEND